MGRARQELLPTECIWDMMMISGVGLGQGALGVMWQCGQGQTLCGMCAYEYINVRMCGPDGGHWVRAPKCGASVRCRLLPADCKLVCILQAVGAC